jgi:hypothetical protein
MPKLPIALAAVLSLVACTAPNPNLTADALYCSYEIAGVQSCVGYGKLSSLQKTAETDACNAESGKIVSSCPKGYVGCCMSSTAGYTTTECFYAGDAAELSQACAGSWSTGDGSGHDGGMTLGGPDMGQPGECTSQQVVCPKGCANLQNDVNNCGSCGYQCPAGSDGTTATCKAGVCGFTGTTCATIVSCYNAATTIADQNACIAAGSPLAQQQYQTALNCVNSACSGAPTSTPDAGTVGSCTLSADCYSCVQSGTSPTNHVNGVCENAEGTQATDPLCGKCVDQVTACIPATS